jgi:protein TonB
VPTTAPAPTADAGNPADAATDATTVTSEPSGDGGSVEADLLKETGSSRLSAMVDAATSGSEERNAKSKMLAVAAMVAVVVVGTLLWFGLSPDGEPTIAEVPETTPTATATDVKVSTPAIDESVDEALQLAESALLESQLQVAAAALQQVADADPDNARLPFLTAQLSQAQLRNNLTEARTAIRDGRFEDAADALSAALALNVVDSSEIDALTTELDNARSNQQTDDVLALANDRLESGDLLTPKNSSARYYYDLVLTNDPDNTAARQGLDIIVSRLVLQARGDIDEGRFDAAQELLYEARSIDSTNAEMIATADALQLARKAAARQAAARRAAAEKAAAEKAAAEKAAAEQAAAEEALAEPASQSGDIAPAEAQSGAAGFGSVQSAGATAPAEATPSPELAAAPPPTDATPTGISSLERTRYIAPKYPRSAVRRNQSGWVDVSFTVATDGSVKDISIRDSEPGDLFVGAATRAVEQWEFKPVVENGVVIEQPAAVRMMFSLD